ncbi:MAG: TAXI family TRAP transporter solute-binding subunit [Myxococcales bacterium]|nr:TAXI family TRAP transporter solute-binding subunit [Myxococcales bacterium]
MKRPLVTPGGARNLELLQRGEADLALVSNHLRGNARVRLIAPLYDECVQLIVRADGATVRPAELGGRRVSLGPAGSGTELMALSILAHHGLARADLTALNLGPEEARDALLDGRLDAMFLVNALRTPVPESLLRGGRARLVSLGDPERRGSALDALRIDSPYLKITVIPERAYGAEPAQPVGTVSTTALLVARRELDEALVADLTASLFRNKVSLAAYDRNLAHLSERFDPGESPYPLHAGADRYLRRDDPNFVDKHADGISLAFTTAALAWSAVGAARAWQRQNRQSRAETFHLAITEVLEALGERPGEDALRRARGRLEALRREVFVALTDEKLVANDGFLILQGRLDGMLAEIDRTLLVKATREAAHHDDGA